MSNAELKQSLYRIIDEIDDQARLEKLYQSLLNQDTNKANASLLASIQRGKEQAKNGKGISHQEAMQKYRK